VATPEPIESSRRLSQAAAAERARLEVELRKAERQELALRKRLAQTEERTAAIRQRLQLLDQLGIGEPRTPGTVVRPLLVPSDAEPEHGWLRGAAIRQVAIRLLAESARPDQPIHYTAWLELLRQAGYGIQGSDPAATFLTQLSRAAAVMRADQPGTYALDFSSPARLRERLKQLNEELLALHQGQQMIEQISSARDRRRELIAEIARTERALEEAIVLVGTDETVEQIEHL
jgi:DNA repair exonuclease SbcCD ATPase subunit